jgi:hypothetical protein
MRERGETERERERPVEVIAAVDEIA